MVRTDWEFAYENLPEKDDDGFATKWAAKAYLGKLYHTLGCQGDNTAWEKAKACFDEVMPNTGWRINSVICLLITYKVLRNLFFN